MSGIGNRNMAATPDNCPSSKNKQTKTEKKENHVSFKEIFFVQVTLKPKEPLKSVKELGYLVFP